MLQDFELATYGIVVQQVGHYTQGTPSSLKLVFISSHGIHYTIYKV